MMDLEIKKEVVDLLGGKRVAFVGPSPHLIGEGLGHKIDDYDIVCRVNDIIDPKFEADYGTRNDIVFHSCPTLWIDSFALQMERDEKITRSIKFVICPALKAIHDGSGSVVENFNKINKYDIPFWWIGTDNYYEIRRKVGVEPNSGIMAILILLSCPIKELLITGFSFYSQYSDKGKYTDCYYNQQNYKPVKMFSETSSPLIGHQQNPQMVFFKNNLIAEYGDKLIIDSFLNEKLSLKHAKIFGE